jgi:Methyltransferase TRM13/CCCH zinc finger in TRM13 protein
MPAAADGDEARCAAFLPRKQRHCRMRPMASSQFCYAHDPAAAGSDAKSRCPHCNSFIARMSYHLRVCPAAVRHAALVAAPYHRPGINLASPPLPVGAVSAKAEPQLPAPLSPAARLRAIDLHAAHAAEFAEMYLPDSVAAAPPEVEVLQAEYADARNSAIRFEPVHFRQNSAIAGVILSSALAPVSTSPAPPVIIELGAGRAYTSLLLAQVLAARTQTPAAVVVVDTASPRRPADNELLAMERGGGPVFCRIRCDLGDLDLAGVDAVRQARGDILFVGKHVCGSALDMSLTAIARFARERDAAAAGSVRFVLASCCRHRCEWNNTCSAASVWQEGWGVGSVEFADLMRMATWGAGCTDCEEDVATGRKVMELVDAARALWLSREHGCNVRLVRYVDVDTSPENCAVVGCWPG